MDYVWVSKVLIIIALYFLLNKVYKSFDWNSSGKMKKPIVVLLFIIFFISAISALSAFTVLVVIVIFPGIFNYLDTRQYWEQIIILFGFIASYFYYKIKIDEINKKKQKQENQIISQNFRISELENEIKMIKNTNSPN